MNMKNKILINAMTAASMVYIIWWLFFTIPFEYGMIAIFFGILLIVSEALDVFELTVQSYGMIGKEKTLVTKPQVQTEMNVDVDVFVATYNESVDLLYKTLCGCLNMDYPDKSKVHIYLCDDSDRLEMKELASKMGVHYITRKEHIGAKAGNLNNAMKHSHSPLIATFDADMIPMRDFLMACVPYFLTGEKVGFVQTPQSFYNPDLFQHGLCSEKVVPNEQDYFFRKVQISRNQSNSVIYAGSNTLISRKALEEIGGFYTEVITEDFATGMLIQSKGYICYAVEKVRACGLAPTDLKSLMKQRDRWARGCIQTFRKLHILFQRGLDLKQKLSYFTCLTYWYGGLKRFCYMVAPILLSVFGIVVLDSPLWGILLLWMPMYFLRHVCLRLFFSGTRNARWSNIYETVFSLPLLPSIIFETLGISKKKFTVTRKDGVNGDLKYQVAWLVPYCIIGILSILGISRCIMDIFMYETLGPVVVLFWLIVNLYNIVMAIFFIIGRPMYRTSERFQVKANCQIRVRETVVRCKTFDISEGGICVALDFSQNPTDLFHEEEVMIYLWERHYHSHFHGKLVRVEGESGQWKCAFQMVRIEEPEKRQFYHMIYDRMPSLPQQIREHIGIFENLKMNIQRRISKRRVAFSDQEMLNDEFSEMDYL